MSNGYNPDTLILTPANAEALDVLVSDITGGAKDYVFAPANFAPGQIFGLNKRISKTIPAATVADSSALGKLYASRVSLARFEENARQDEHVAGTAGDARRVRGRASERRRPDRRRVAMAAKKKHTTDAKPKPKRKPKDPVASLNRLRGAPRALVGSLRGTEALAWGELPGGRCPWGRLSLPPSSAPLFWSRRCCPSGSELRWPASYLPRK
jgi:hypothetical protein